MFLPQYLKRKEKKNKTKQKTKKKNRWSVVFDIVKIHVYEYVKFWVIS